MTGDELALRQQAAAIPSVLQKLGVGWVDEDGHRAIVIPPDLREKCNVLSPRDEITQADPMWQPAVRLLKMAEEKYWYAQDERNDKHAMTAVALNEVGGFAGVELVNMKRMDRRVLSPSEIGWEVTPRIRQSDGRWHYGTPGTKTLDKDLEREIIEAQVESTVRKYAVKDNLDTEEKILARVKQKARERWLKEAPYLDEKCQKKAANRAIRNILALPHTFTKAQTQKPFLIVSVNFTPDYSDAETRRMVLEAGLSNAAAVYGQEYADPDDDMDDVFPVDPQPYTPPVVETFIDVDPEDDDQPDPEPPEDDPEPPASDTEADSAGDHVIGWGAKLKGTRIRDLKPAQLLWLCELPDARGGVVESQRCAKLYRSSQPVEGEVS